MTALQALNPDALPTPKDEVWKYTNLPRAVPKGLAIATDKEEIIIHVPRGETMEKEIVFTGRDGVLHMPVLKIIVEEGASCTVTERHDGGGAYWKNMVTEIEIAKNARLTHVRLQEDSGEAVHTNMVQMDLARDAVYNGFSFNEGAKLSRHDIRAALTEKNINCSFYGINLLRGAQHGDTTIVMEHQAPHGQSNQFYRSVLDDQARGVFQGKVHVHQAAQKTDGYQLSNALLLSEGAEMDTKPELEIYADDVKCSHGATTGQLDDDVLFYMRSRGMNEDMARGLMIESFVAEVAEKIEDDAMRDTVMTKVKTWLGN